jgi:hypothetical protein
MIVLRAFIVLASLLLPALGQAQGLQLYPNRQLTPGAINPRLTPTYLCSHPTSDRRNVPVALKKQVFTAYHIPYEARPRYEVDHFVPLALGGVNTCSDNPTCNLWPQPHQKSFPQIAPWGSETKDVLEGALYRTLCARKKPARDAQWLDNARTAMASDWVHAYGVYVGTFSTEAPTPVRHRRRARRAKR